MSVGKRQNKGIVRGVITMLDIATIVAQAESLCRAIAPQDLADAPLYIVPQSRVPDDLGGKSICGGFTSPSLDLYLQPVLGSQWRGRGPCMVVNDTDYEGTMDAIDIEQEFFRTVLHELAHLLRWPVPTVAVPPVNPVRIKFDSLCLGRFVAEEPTVEERPVPFHGHEAPFIRTVLHLRHRADAIGTTIAPWQLCAGRDYGLSHANCYRKALGDEPQRLADLSIREINGRPMPESFSRLWSDDMLQWRSSPTFTQGGVCMSLSTLIEKVIGKQQERQKARLADFGELVRRIADGKEPDVEEVDRVLAEAGKSLDELQKAVERLQHRRQLRAQWDGMPALEAEYAEVQSRMTAANKLFEEADKLHTETTFPLSGRLKEIRDACSAAEKAKAELWQTCKDPALGSEMGEVKAQSSEADRELSDLKRQIDNWKMRARSARAEAERIGQIINFEREAEEARAVAEQHERKAAECESRLPKVQKQIATLERKAEAIRERMLEP